MSQPITFAQIGFPKINLNSTDAGQYFWIGVDRGDTDVSDYQISWTKDSSPKPEFDNQWIIKKEHGQYSAAEYNGKWRATVTRQSDQQSKEYDWSMHVTDESQELKNISVEYTNVTRTDNPSARVSYARPGESVEYRLNVTDPTQDVSISWYKLPDMVTLTSLEEGPVALAKYRLPEFDNQSDVTITLDASDKAPYIYFPVITAEGYANKKLDYALVMPVADPETAVANEKTNPTSIILPEVGAVSVNEGEPLKLGVFSINPLTDATNSKFYKDGRLLSETGKYLFMKEAVEKADAGQYKLTVTTGEEEDPQTHDYVWDVTVVPAEVEKKQLTESVVLDHPTLTLYAGQSGKITVTGLPEEDVPFTFLWKKDGGSLSDITDNEDHLQLDSVSSDKAGQYTVEISHDGYDAKTLTATVTVRDVPAKLEKVAFKVGEDATFGLVSNESDVTYQWLKDSNPVEEGGDTYQIHKEAITAEDQGHYTLNITGDGFSTSIPFDITVAEAELLEFDARPSFPNIEIYEGNQVYLTVIVDSGPEGTQYSWTGPDGEIDHHDHLLIVPAPKTGKYIARLTHDGYHDKEVVFNITVKPNKEFQATLDRDTIHVFEGETIGKVVVNITGELPTSSDIKKGGSELEYRQYNYDDDEEDHPSFTLTNKASQSDAGEYEIVLKGQHFNDKKLTFTVVVHELLHADSTTVAAKEGESLSFGFSDEIDAGSGSLTYQWLKDGEPSDVSPTFSVRISKAKLTDAGTYTLHVTGQFDEHNPVDYTPSDAFTVTVNPAEVVNVLPGLTRVGNDTEVTEKNQSVTFGYQDDSQSLSDHHYTVIWTKDESELPDASGLTLTINNIEESNEGIYKAVIHDGDFTRSEEWMLTVTIPEEDEHVSEEPKLITATRDPDGDVTKKVGEALTLHVNGADDGDYQFAWTKDEKPLSGASGSTYTLDSATSDSQGQYKVTVTRDGYTPLELTWAVTINAEEEAEEEVPAAKPIVKERVGDADTITLTEGQELRIGATVTDPASGVTYKWYHNDGLLDGASDGVYVVSAVELASAGTYRVDITADGYTAASESFTVQVTARAKTVHDATRVGEETITLTADEALSIGIQLPEGEFSDVTYSWKKDSELLADKTEATLSIEHVATTDAGQYEVTATQGGEKQSFTFTVAVNEKPKDPEETDDEDSHEDEEEVASPKLASSEMVGQSPTVLTEGNRLTIGLRLPEGYDGTGVTYSWTKDSQPLLSASGAELTISAVSVADAGKYSVTASKADDSVTKTFTVKVTSTSSPEDPDGDIGEDGLGKEEAGGEPGTSEDHGDAGHPETDGGQPDGGKEDSPVQPPESEEHPKEEHPEDTVEQSISLSETNLGIVNEGDVVSVTASVKPEQATLQWYQVIDNQELLIEGQTGKELRITMDPGYGKEFFLRASYNGAYFNSEHVVISRFVPTEVSLSSSAGKENFEEGSSMTYSFTAVPDDRYNTIEWFFQDVEGRETKLEGEISSTLVVSPLTIADSGRYYAKVTRKGSTAEFRTAMKDITVVEKRQPKQFTIHLEVTEGDVDSVVRPSGGTFVLRAIATGEAQFTDKTVFKWYRRLLGHDPVLLGAQTTQVLQLSNLTAEDIGNYRVVVEGDGTGESTYIRLNVVDSIEDVQGSPSLGHEDHDSEMNPEEGTGHRDNTIPPVLDNNVWLSAKRSFFQSYLIAMAVGNPISPREGLLWQRRLYSELKDVIEHEDLDEFKEGMDMVIDMFGAYRRTLFSMDYRARFLEFATRQELPKDDHEAFLEIMNIFATMADPQDSLYWSVDEIGDVVKDSVLLARFKEYYAKKVESGKASDGISEVGFSREGVSVPRNQK